MIKNKLGGITWAIDPFKYDYPIIEVVKCLQDMCDEVVVLDAGSDADTLSVIDKLADDKTQVLKLERELWDRLQGREKLAYYQNIAISLLDSDYYFLAQADELVPESCFPTIRKAIETDKEAFYIKRLNLWGDCNHYLSVPEHRQPCSTNVIRLAKTKYESVGDGESIDAPAVTDFLDEITILHYGFVRSKQVMIEKIKNMQTNVFQIPYDPKLNNMEVFDWRAWFSEEDLKVLNMKHPKYIMEWIKSRP